MNINHEYWHLREHDPNSPPGIRRGALVVRLDIKFSFSGNCLDEGNEVAPLLRRLRAGAPVPQPQLDRTTSTGRASERSPDGTRLQTTCSPFSTASPSASSPSAGSMGPRPAESATCARPAREGVWLGDRPSRRGHAPHAPPTNAHQRLLTDLSRRPGPLGQFLPGLFVCDMSVMPFTSAANPVRTLVALALRLANDLDT